jgi:hypothetical protein
MLPLIFNFLSLLVLLPTTGFKRLGIGQRLGTHKLPPLGPNLTPFRTANPVAFNLNIAGPYRKCIFTTQKEKIQDNSEKRVEILTPK